MIPRGKKQAEGSWVYAICALSVVCICRYVPVHTTHRGVAYADILILVYESQVGVC